ncbi:MAG: succinylglutamate desuccinylase/aspartoacylase family protein, partial [Pirellulales bacterium]|nr:succinylglutamate desuccinylase/aspartoacylase family protein [Pirellulales bacterium]
MSIAPSDRCANRALSIFNTCCLALAAIALGHTAAASRAATVERFVLAQGTRWETPYYVQDTQIEGPTIVILGGVHGNEPAGAGAADQVRHWPVSRGRLIVLPRANQPALRANTRCIPGVKKPRGNLNRNFPKCQGAGLCAGELSTILWRWLRTCRPDWVIDLHEGVQPHQINSKSVGNTVIVYSEGQAKTVAPLLIEAVNSTIDEEKEQFVKITGHIDGCLAKAASAHLGAETMICETTRKLQPLSQRTRQHRVIVHRLLTQLEMLPADASTDWLVDRRREPDRLAVALYDAGGTGGSGVPNLTRLLRAKPHVAVAHVGPPEINDRTLAQFDVVIFPGGSGSRQAKAIGSEGRQAVARFVERGGGYLGICA